MKIVFDSLQELMDMLPALQEMKEAREAKPAQNGAAVERPTGEAARKLLKKLSGNPEYVRIFQAVADAGEEGITSAELAHAVGLQQDVLGKRMALFGRVKNRIPGWDGVNAFKQEWLRDKGMNRYWSHPSVRIALGGLI